MTEESTQAEDLADQVMCTCSGTTRGKIYDLFMQGKDLESISRYSGALSGCGGCEWDIGEFVKALAEVYPLESLTGTPVDSEVK